MKKNKKILAKDSLTVKSNKELMERNLSKYIQKEIEKINKDQANIRIYCHCPTKCNICHCNVVGSE